MALSLFGGRRGGGFDPFDFGTVWDPTFSSVLDASAVVKSIRAQMDWRETPEAHIIKADLPGMRKEEVKVQVVEPGKTLEISGERKREEDVKGETWHRVERSSGAFVRRFRLPENTDVGRIQAQVQDGVLTVTVPKLQKPKPQVRQIEIS